MTMDMMVTNIIDSAHKAMNGRTQSVYVSVNTTLNSTVSSDGQGSRPVVIHKTHWPITIQNRLQQPQSGHKASIGFGNIRIVSTRTHIMYAITVCVNNSSRREKQIMIKIFVGSK